jgi:DNA-binding MarR family transcriptional regulator
LSALVQWRRENPLGRDVSRLLLLCTWLLHGPAAKPIGDLFKQTLYSEPIWRRALMDLVRSGYATIQADPVDTRRRLVRATPLLREKLKEWRRHLLRLLGEQGPVAK